MATTTYTITTAEGVVATKSKKATAIAFADSLGVDATVSTGTGTVVHEAKGPKKIKMSAPYTRVVALPEGEMIKGKRVAYKRPRVGFALLDSGRGDYAIYDMVADAILEDVEVATTRDAGRWFADEAKAYRASLDA